MTNPKALTVAEAFYQLKSDLWQVVADLLTDVTWQAEHRAVKHRISAAESRGAIVGRIHALTAYFTPDEIRRDDPKERAL